MCLINFRKLFHAVNAIAILLHTCLIKCVYSFITNYGFWLLLSWNEMTSAYSNSTIKQVRTRLITIAMTKTRHKIQRLRIFICDDPWIYERSSLADSYKVSNEKESERNENRWTYSIILSRFIAIFSPSFFKCIYILVSFPNQRLKLYSIIQNKSKIICKEIKIEDGIWPSRFKFSYNLEAWYILCYFNSSLGHWKAAMLSYEFIKDMRPKYNMSTRMQIIAPRNICISQLYLAWGKWRGEGF